MEVNPGIAIASLGMFIAAAFPAALLGLVLWFVGTQRKDPREIRIGSWIFLGSLVAGRASATGLWEMMK
jgi:hypothetical protein